MLAIILWLIVILSIVIATTPNFFIAVLVCMVLYIALYILFSWIGEVAGRLFKRDRKPRASPQQSREQAIREWEKK